MLRDGWFNYPTTMPAIWSFIAQRKHCKPNIIDQLLSCPQIKYVLPLIALHRSSSVFHIKESGAFLSSRKGWEFCYLFFYFFRRRWSCLFRPTGLSEYSILSVLKKLFLSFFPPSLLSEQNRWHHRRFFSNSLDLTCWWNGAFTLYCSCRCVAVHF